MRLAPFQQGPFWHQRHQVALETAVHERVPVPLTYRRAACGALERARTAFKSFDTWFGSLFSGIVLPNRTLRRGPPEHRLFSGRRTPARSPCSDPLSLCRFERLAQRGLRFQAADQDLGQLSAGQWRHPWDCPRVACRLAASPTGARRPCCSRTMKDARSCTACRSRAPAARPRRFQSCEPLRSVAPIVVMSAMRTARASSAASTLRTAP